MGTFGEIAEPSNRTAWEEWDELVYNGSQPYPDLHLLENFETPNKIDTFIILEGRYLSDYIRDKNELELVNSITEVNLRLYRTKTGNNYVCVVQDYNLVQSSEIVEVLKSYIEASTDVIAVLAKPLVEYQVSQPLARDYYVIRSICASTQTSRPANIKFSHLEQPNIITGISAGVLSLREITDKPALAVVVFMEYQDQQFIPELQDLLETYKIVSHKTKGKRDALLNSNLYI